MKPFHHLFSTLFLALALAAAGCGPSDSPDAGGEAGSDTTSSDTTGTAGAGSLDFQGSFSGPLGVQLWSFRNFIPQDVPGTLARVRALGFQEVELAGTYGMTPQQFRQELDRAGLTATAMHVPYERLRDSLSYVLDEAEALGVEYVGVAWIPHPEGEPFTEAMARQTAADFNRWGQAASERGLTFFYHTHGFEFRPTPSGVIPFDVLMAETNPEHVVYEMDVFWVTRPGQDPAALLRKYPDRWKLMHVKDMRQGTPTNDFTGQAPPETEVPVGSGQIDYREVLKAAQEVGVERYYIEDETARPFESIPQSIEFMESVTY